MSHQPYIGLRPFERSETEIFFGRETHSDELINALGNSHFLAVIGTSGCGKSSLVKTGLIAGLEAGYLAKAGTHWRIVEMRPGQQPFQVLAERLFAELKTVLPSDYTVETLRHQLRQGSLSLHELLAKHPLPNQAQLLIVCDQFEEIFRYFQQGESAEARNFVSLLLASSKPYPLSNASVSHSVYVVITMRSDFLGDCAQFAGLAEAINQGLYLTPRLDEQQLRAAIEEPAFVFGGEVEPALVTQLLEDAGNNPDQLPLLQHVLMVMWRFAKKQPIDGVIKLDLPTYEKAGGLKNALSQHADVVFEQMLSPEQQRIAEILFRNLTENDDQLRDTRRPVLLSEVAELAGVQWQQVAEVVKVFRENERSFLSAKPEILTPDSLLDISHESLIRQWQRLKNWVEDEAQAAQTYRHLLESALRYRNKQVGLLQSPELDIMLQWQKSFQPTAQWAKRYGKYEKDFALAEKYLNTSQTTYQQRQQSESKRRRFLVIGLIIFSVIVSGLAGFSFWQYLKAEQQTKFALTSIKNLTYDLIDDLIKRQGTLPIIEKTVESNILLLEKINTPDAIRIKGVNFGKLGAVYLQLGHKQQALEKYQTSVEILQQLIKQDSQNVEVQKDLYVSLNDLAKIYWQLADKEHTSFYQEQALITENFLKSHGQQNLPKSFEKPDDSDEFIKSTKIGESFGWLVFSFIRGFNMITFIFYFVFFVVLVFVPGLLIYYLSDVNPDDLYLKGLEIILSVFVVGILVSQAIPLYNNYMEKSKNSKSLFEIANLKIDATIYYAEYGIWPPAKVMDNPYYSDNEIKTLENNGIIVIHKKDKNQQLTLTGLVRKDEQGTETDSILWLCGYAKAPSGYSKSSSVPLTTIPASQLPSGCDY